MSHLQSLQGAIEKAGLGALLLMDDKNIFYATGFMPSDSAALVTPDRAWLVTDSRYIEDAERKCVQGVEVVLTTASSPLGAALSRLVSGLSGAVGAEENKLSHGMYVQMERLLGRELVPAGEMVQQLRAHKTADELQLLIAAQRTAEKALEETLPMIKPGMTYDTQLTKMEEN